MVLCELRSELQAEIAMIYVRRAYVEDPSSITALSVIRHGNRDGYRPTVNDCSKL